MPKSHTAPRRHKPKRGVVRKADDTGLVRLQKVLAAAGVGSRRQCEEIIRQGRVDVDGKMVSELGTRVDPFQHKIRVDGETVSRPKRRHYFLINKPMGILSTNQDPSGRPHMIDLAPSRERLFTVGRLDKTSEGLILATNDGQLTDLLTHPRYGVEKTYWALVAGSVSPEAASKLERGVHLAEGFAHAKRVTVRRAHKQSTILEIVLDEGRNREVRRLLARIGHKVLKLRRIAIGPLRLGNMKPGENRPLLRDEVEALYEAARQRRRQSDKGTKKPTTRLKTAADSQGLDASDGSGREDEVRPLIDHSLSPDELNEQDAISIGDGFDDEFHDDESGNEPGFEGLADGDEFVDDSNQELATARVDLSPILPGKPGRGSERTLIGGDPQRRKNFRNVTPPRRSRRKAAGQHRGSQAEAAMTASVAKNPLRAAFYADRACQVATAIVENVKLARDTYRVRFECPEIARRIVPGQFVMLRLAGCDDPLLGRPLAMYDTVLSPAGEPMGLDVVYLTAGKFTRRLGELRPRRVAGRLGSAGKRFHAAIGRTRHHGGRRHRADAILVAGRRVAADLNRTAKCHARFHGQNRCRFVTVREMPSSLRGSTISAGSDWSRT